MNKGWYVAEDAGEMEALGGETNFDDAFDASDNGHNVQFVVTGADAGTSLNVAGVGVVSQSNLVGGLAFFNLDTSDWEDARDDCSGSPSKGLVQAVGCTSNSQLYINMGTLGFFNSFVSAD